MIGEHGKRCLKEQGLTSMDSGGYYTCVTKTSKSRVKKGMGKSERLQRDQDVT